MQAHLHGHRCLRQQQQPDPDHHRQRQHRPVITGIPADVTVQCASAVPAPNDAGVVATDNCSGAVVITHSDQTIPGSCANKFVIKRTYTATDVCGNSSSQTQTITVNDNTAPVITGIPADVTVPCASAVPAPNDAAVVAADNCSGTVVITHSDQTIPGSCVNKFVIKRTYTATDVCGNSSSQIQSITVNDNVPPTMTVPPDLTLECPADLRTNVTGTATGQDGCGSVSITYSDLVTNFCGGSKMISRIWTVADACGNATNAMQTITVRDTTPPALRLPANVVQECPGDTRTNVTGVRHCSGRLQRGRDQLQRHRQQQLRQHQDHLAHLDGGGCLRQQHERLADHCGAGHHQAEHHVPESHLPMPRR